MQRQPEGVVVSINFKTKLILKKYKDELKTVQSK